MRKGTVVLAVVVLSVVVLAVVVPVMLLAAQPQSQQRGRASLTALDYAEIQQLYGRYAIGYDTGNGDLYASVFTPDGAFETPGGKTLQGRKQLAELAAAPGSNKGPTNVRHVNANITIEPSAEGATGIAYVMLVNLGAGGTPSTLSGGGVYRDVFVKTAEGWRIKRRTYQPAHSVPGSSTQP